MSNYEIVRNQFDYIYNHVRETNQYFNYLNDQFLSIYLKDKDVNSLQDLLNIRLEYAETIRSIDENISKELTKICNINEQS